MIEPIDDSFSVIASSPESLKQQRIISTGLLNHAMNDRCMADEHENDYGGAADEDFVFNHATIRQPHSTRSSISSFPASVIHNDPYNNFEDESRTPSKSYTGRIAQDQMRIPSPVIGKHSPARGYHNGFRNPSSVRALQMCESEYDDSDGIAPYHRRKDSRISHMSHRSSNSLSSSPTKRSSRPNTPRRHMTSTSNSSTKMKKEFPLVLLHCTLLPPTVASRGALVTDEILEAILPEQYRKRWRTLQDKTIKNMEVKQRGVLIPHPRDEYELLEERLLEALELQRPRIRQNHYLGPNADADSGFESGASQTDDSSSEDGDAAKESLREKCPDCGTHVTFHDVERERKWEVKVYAANGLMRSGAWSAAWSEMEKVDVEVGVWMPEDVRMEVDSKLEMLLAKQEAEAEEERLAQEDRELEEREQQRQKTETEDQPFERSRPRNQEEIDGLDEDSAKPHAFTQEPQRGYTQSGPSHGELTIQQLIQYRVNKVFQDQRNIAILLLSLLVLFFAITSASREGTAAKAAAAVELANTNVNASVSSVLSNVESIISEVTQPVQPTVQYVTTTVFASDLAESASSTVTEIFSPETTQTLIPEVDSWNIKPEIHELTETTDETVKDTDILTAQATDHVHTLDTAIEDLSNEDVTINPIIETETAEEEKIRIAAMEFKIDTPLSENIPSQIDEQTVLDEGVETMIAIETGDDIEEGQEQSTNLLDRV